MAAKNKSNKKELELNDLHANPVNPRKAWSSQKRKADFKKSLAEFGDLSGIVFNATTKQLVGGHKRVEAFKDDGKHSIVITDKLTKPDSTGTVAFGHVALSSGARFSYREVKWTKEKEAAANLAANKWGAEWDNNLMATVLDDAKAGGFDLALVGFTESELADLAPSDDTVEVSEEAEVPFTRAMGERNSYIVLVFKTELDWVSAISHFKLSKVASKRRNGKKWLMGVGRVLDGAEYLTSLQEQ